MSNKLIIERRGCPWVGVYAKCKEAQNSDFDNFRYYTKILKVENGNFKFYHLELTIHERENQGKVLSYLDFSRMVDGDLKGLPQISGYCGPYKKDVLEKINKELGTNYDEIEIVERID